MGYGKPEGAALTRNEKHGNLPSARVENECSRLPVVRF